MQRAGVERAGRRAAPRGQVRDPGGAHVFGGHRVGLLRPRPAFRDVYGAPFTESPEVVRAVASLGVVFAFSLLLNSVQPVLSGVAVGAGWQWLVAYINLGCYYLVGIPVGYIIAFPLRGGVQGMWGGMLTGVGLQTLILVAITLRTNWDKEASEAHSRIQKWGGSAAAKVSHA